MSDARPLPPRKLGLVGLGVAVGFAAGFLICYGPAKHHWLSPPTSLSEMWMSNVRQADAIIVTRIADARTVVIQPSDGRYEEIVNGTVRTIDEGSFYPAAISP